MLNVLRVAFYEYGYKGGIALNPDRYISDWLLATVEEALYGVRFGVGVEEPSFWS